MQPKFARFTVLAHNYAHLNPFSMKKLFTIASLVVAMLILFHAFSPAQAQISVESRLTRLEADLVGIQAQLNQLAAGRSSGINVPTPAPLSLPASGARVSNAQFDRLANLLIELKQRVNTLEAKVNKLERR